MDFDAGFEELTSSKLTSSRVILIDDDSPLHDPLPTLVDDYSPLHDPLPMPVWDPAVFDIGFGLLNVTANNFGAKHKSAPASSPYIVKMEAVAKMWMRGKLHVGSRLQADFVNPNLSSHSVPKLQARMWDLSGMVREGWCEVGAGGSRRRGDISHTNRELDV